MRKRVLAACAGVLILSAPLLAASNTWELREGGRWDQLPGAASSQPAAGSPDPLLDAAERMIATGQGKAGAKTAIQWLRTHPQKETPLRDRALFLAAEGYFVDGKRVDAFFYLDQLMDENPESAYFHQALQRQYDIADQYLKGYKRVFLYWAILPAEDEAVDMLYRIQQRAPGSLLAEKALLRTADWYYSTSAFDLAADAYAAYERNYPRSPYLARVRLRRAYSDLAQFRSTWHDPTHLLDARAQLVDMIAAYPELADQEDLPALLARIDDSLADKVYRTADFYRRTSKPQAARYYYNYLVATFPKSPKLDDARRRLAELPAVASEAPAAYEAAPVDVKVPTEER
jgi:outer membrane assembly lipoprotein YfiO